MKSLLPVCFLLAGTVCFGYVSSNTHRADNTNIQFLVNVSSANVNNTKGVPWITPGTDVYAAVVAAEGAWGSVATANIHFAQPLVTTLFDDANSDNNVISFDTGAEATQLINGSAIAVTDRIYNPSTFVIIKTDIVFSQTDQFSTTGDPNSYDLQSILTHELGHCLGSSHSGVLSATMFQATGVAFTDQAHLRPDDLAFATSTYPASSGYGTIAGTMRDTNGLALRGALISAEDPVTGDIIGGFSSTVDGTFAFVLPQGNYYVWAEPLNGEVQVGNVYLNASEVDTDWQPIIAGGFGAPSTVPVSAGQTTTVSFSAPVGVSPIQFSFAGFTPVANPGNSVTIYSGPTDIPGGQEVYFLFQATGLGSDLTDSNFRSVGPITIVPGSFHSLGSSQYQLTLNVPSVAELTTTTLFISYQGNTASFTGGLVAQPPVPAFASNSIGNAFSYAATAVAPGEIVAIFGTNMGPASGLTGSFTTADYITTQVEGISVRFDGIPAPLFYAGAGQINVQVPYEVLGNSSTNIVVDTGTNSSIVNVPVTAAIPGLFTYAVNFVDNSLNTAANPVTRGDYVILYATGLGAPQTALFTGESAPGVDPSANAVVVSVGGIPVTPYYAGVSPGFVGLDQISVQIPTGLGAGVTQLFVTSANGSQSVAIPVYVQ